MPWATEERTTIIINNVGRGGIGIMMPEYGTVITATGDSLQDGDAKLLLSW
jgi:hypothetical protein